MPDTQKGWKLTEDKDNIKLKMKHSFEVQSQDKHEKRSVVWSSNEFRWNILDDRPVKITVIEIHNKLGHMSFQQTKQDVKELRWILTVEERCM
jgi:hypothetical protein